jgi:hypothetical protein
MVVRHFFLPYPSVHAAYMIYTVANRFFNSQSEFPPFHFRVLLCSSTSRMGFSCLMIWILVCGMLQLKSTATISHQSISEMGFSSGDFMVQFCG